jgi:hypothetical protein
MSSFKKMTCKRTLRQVFICLKTRSPNPPSHTDILYTVYILIHIGKGEGARLNQREG